MSNAAWALQQAVFAALSADDAVQELVEDRIFDAPPRRAAFPYVVIGEAEENSADTATEEGSEHVLSLHAWSRGGGSREIKQIASALRRVLNEDLPLDGHSLIDLHFLTASYARQSDGETWRAIVRLRALTEPLGKEQS